MICHFKDLQELERRAFVLEPGDQITLRDSDFLFRFSKDDANDLIVQTGPAKAEEAVRVITAVLKKFNKTIIEQQESDSETDSKEQSFSSEKEFCITRFTFSCDRSVEACPHISRHELTSCDALLQKSANPDSRWVRLLLPCKVLIDYDTAEYPKPGIENLAKHHIRTGLSKGALCSLFENLRAHLSETKNDELQES